MKVFVESCYHGHDRFSFRLYAGRERIHYYMEEGKSEWNNQIASKAKRLVQQCTGIEPKNIRFEHK